MEQPFCSADMYTAKRLILCILYSCFKNGILIPVERRVNDHAQHSAGNDFADTYGQHHKRNRERNLISKSEYKRNDQRVGQNRGHRREKTVIAAQLIGKYSADQGCQASADDVWNDASAQNVAEQAADEQSGDGRRGKYRKDGQGFGNTDLNFSVTEGCEDKGQHHVDGSNHRCLCNELHIQGLLFFHFLFSFSFVLRVEGLEHSD